MARSQRREVPHPSSRLSLAMNRPFLGSGSNSYGRWFAALLLGLVGGSALAQPTNPVPGSPSSGNPAPATNPLPGQNPMPVPGSHAALLSLPLNVEGVTPKRPFVLSYSGSRYRPVTSFSEWDNRRLVRANPNVLHYEPNHLRMNDVELFAEEFGPYDPRTFHNRLLRMGPASSQQAFPDLDLRMPNLRREALRYRRR